MTKLEEIARAIRDAFPHQTVGRIKRPSWEELGPSDRATWLFMARAAIKALMGPSDEIMEAGANGVDAYFHGTKDAPFERSTGAAFDAMLQAILDEESETDAAVNA